MRAHDPPGDRDGRGFRGSGGAVMNKATHFDLKKVLGRSVDLLKGLLSGLGDRLHFGGVRLRRGRWGRCGPVAI
jgi:hypothetical protein